MKRTATIWTKLPVLVLAATLVRPLWGAPADILDSPAPVPGDPAPKTRSIGAGDATVATQTGALEYGYPISVPPGRGAATPKLALHYSSGGAIYGSGLGHGWSLPIPEIRRDKSVGTLETRWVSSMAGGKHLVEVTESAPAGTEATFRAQHDSSYARYQKLEPDVNGRVVWRVLTPDGMTYFFGEPERIENDGNVGDIDIPPHRFPLTRSVDSFGNTVEYIWHVSVVPQLVGPFPGRALRLERIEYSSNDGPTPVDAHARVTFQYASPQYCSGSTFPIGASQEIFDPDEQTIFDHQIWYEGAHPLIAIDTWVKDSESAPAFRKVRRYALENQASPTHDPPVCSGDVGAYRQLSKITEIGDPDGVGQELPAVTFSYAQPNRHAKFPKPINMPTGVGTPDTWLAAGARYPGGNRFTEVDYMLGDLDGDNRLDMLRVDESGGSCRLSWYRNISRTTQASVPIDFDSLPTTTWLPTLPWETGGLPSGDERCSLTGQYYHRSVIPPNPQCGDTNFGSYLVYRLLDVNGDGLPDLVSAVHAERDDAFSYDPVGDVTATSTAASRPAAASSSKITAAFSTSSASSRRSTANSFPTRTTTASSTRQGCRRARQQRRRSPATSSSFTTSIRIRPE